MLISKGAGDIKGHKRASCVGFTDSQIYNFLASDYVVLHEYLL